MACTVRRYISDADGIFSFFFKIDLIIVDIIIMRIHRVALIHSNGQVFNYCYFTRRRTAEQIAKKQKHLIAKQDWKKLITTHEFDVSKNGMYSMLIQLASHGNLKDIRK